MIDNAFRARVWALAAEGLSHRAIGRALDSNHTTVAAVLKSPPPLEPPPARPLPAHCAPPVLASPGTDSPDAPALQVVRELLAEARNQFAVATASGDSNGAQRYARTAAGLMPVLARLEREAHDASGGFVITEQDVAEANSRIDTVLNALAARGAPRCAKCSRELSIAWGHGVPEDEIDGDEWRQ